MTAINIVYRHLGYPYDFKDIKKLIGQIIPLRVVWNHHSKGGETWEGNYKVLDVVHNPKECKKCTGKYSCNTKTRYYIALEEVATKGQKKKYPVERWSCSWDIYDLREGHENEMWTFKTIRPQEKVKRLI